jgi:ankyrin repeat protein
MRRPLEIAVSAADKAMVELLMRQGADPTLVNSDGKSVIEQAAGRDDILAVLESAAI